MRQRALALRGTAHPQCFNQRMLTERLQQNSQIKMLILQRQVVPLLAPVDLGNGQLITLHLGRQHIEATAALDSYAQQAIGPLLPIANQRLTAGQGIFARR